MLEPNPGSQLSICSNPIRYDSYRGCSHGCVYCFSFLASKKNGRFDEPVKGKLNELVNFLKRTDKLPDYIKGTPIHWGGMSDGFQPCEKTIKESYKSLKVMSLSSYPVTISTKGITLLASDMYIELLKKCNVVIQHSLLSCNCENYDTNAPSYQDRLSSIKKLSQNGFNIVIRVQPYFPKEKKNVIKMIYDTVDYVHSYTFEGFKTIIKQKKMVYINGEYVYPIKTLLNDFLEFKKIIHDNKKWFYSGENRLRWLGDSVNCCGVDKINGFDVCSKTNATKLFFDMVITGSNIKEFCGNVVSPGCFWGQDTISRKTVMKYNSDYEKPLYTALIHYINSKKFEDRFELKPIGVDDKRNIKYVFKDKHVEKERIKSIETNSQ